VKLRWIILFVIAPFLFIVIINESSRLSSDKFEKKINSSERDIASCTWLCHNQTSHCKKHHVTFLKSYLSKTDHLYFGLIGLLQSSGSYKVANLFFLLFLVPVLVLFFCIKSFLIELKIRAVKS